MHSDARYLLDHTHKTLADRGLTLPDYQAKVSGWPDCELGPLHALEMSECPYLYESPFYTGGDAVKHVNLGVFPLKDGTGLSAVQFSIEDYASDIALLLLAGHDDTLLHTSVFPPDAHGDACYLTPYLRHKMQDKPPTQIIEELSDFFLHGEINPHYQ